MTVTIEDYASKPPTGQAQAFIEWVTAEAGMTFRARAAQEAFERGLYMGVHGYKLFQEANREARAKATRKPRARRAAPVAEVAAPAVKRTRAPKAQSRKSAA